MQDKAQILDLGCSDGSLVEALCNEGFHAIGMDISSTIITQAKKESPLELIEADFENEWPEKDLSEDPPIIDNENRDIF